MPRLGRAHGSPGRPQSFARSMAIAVKIERAALGKGAGKSQFTGARIGRGGSTAALLSSSRFAGPRTRRVVVKARIVKLGTKGLSNAKAHLRYIQRDGVTRDGMPGALYGRDSDAADGRAFIERAEGDRHQFRFIVAPEDGAAYDDLKPVIRRLMIQAEQDLGTRLDWVAVDHFNTGHPHSHVIVRGKDELGKDLIIAPAYMTNGFRERAIDIVSGDLGPRTDLEIHRALTSEMEQERFTSIDGQLIADRGEDGLVSPVANGAMAQTLKAGRLQMLGRLGLAHEDERGRWRLHDDLEPVLRRMGERGDIIKTMHRDLAARGAERHREMIIATRTERSAKPIVGRLIRRGLSDEYRDRHYLVIEGIDGRSHYVDIGAPESLRMVPEDSVLRIVPRSMDPRPMDGTVAEVAKASGGYYSSDHHMHHDIKASEAFAHTHERRLEAMRRAIGYPDRQKDGQWIIEPDHIDRVKSYEAKIAERMPVVIETLSTTPVDRQVRVNAVTWLDREITAANPEPLGDGFGRAVETAKLQRQRWLVEQELAEFRGNDFFFQRNLLAILQRREMTAAAQQLEEELGLPYVQAKPYDQISGRLVRQVQLESGKYALVQKSKEFTLLPWRPVLEKAMNKQVSGLMREGGSISWTFGRERGGPGIS
nr:relaxase/mobilization nuclease RlxS [Sphingobium boeckii]